MAYLFFFPACISGPSFDYKDFDDFMNLEGDYEDIPLNLMEVGK